MAQAIKRLPDGKDAGDNGGRQAPFLYQWSDMDPFSPIVLFALSTSISPGPNNVMIMSSGANRGVLKSLPMLLGICIGFPLMVPADC